MFSVCDRGSLFCFVILHEVGWDWQNVLEREAVKAHVISKLISLPPPLPRKLYPPLGLKASFQLTCRELSETQYPMASSSNAFNQNRSDFGAACPAKTSIHRILHTESNMSAFSRLPEAPCKRVVSIVSPMDTPCPPLNPTSTTITVEVCHQTSPNKTPAPPLRSHHTAPNLTSSSSPLLSIQFQPRP